jgi:anti-anti-sigma factor
MRMSRVVRYPEGTVVEMHDNPCSTPEDYDKVKQQIIDAGRLSTRVVVDCRAVNMLGASFLSALVVAYRQIGARPGDLVLCRLQPVLRQVFTLTRLDQLLPICETREEALEAPWPDPLPHVVE